MGREKTFLERIASLRGRAGARYQPTAKEDVDALMDSVGRHLARLLNARHGMSLALPDYGLPALTDLTIGSGDYVSAVQDSIRVAIEKYEPRLRRVRVVRLDDENADRCMLRFRIEATLVGQNERHVVWYETMLRSDGQFEVSD